MSKSHKASERVTNPESYAKFALALYLSMQSTNPQVSFASGEAKNPTGTANTKREIKASGTMRRGFLEQPFEA